MGVSICWQEKWPRPDRGLRETNYQMERGDIGEAAFRVHGNSLPPLTQSRQGLILAVSTVAL